MAKVPGNTFGKNSMFGENSQLGPIGGTSRLGTGMQLEGDFVIDRV